MTPIRDQHLAAAVADCRDISRNMGDALKAVDAMTSADIVQDPQRAIDALRTLATQCRATADLTVRTIENYEQRRATTLRIGQKIIARAMGGRR